jgi:hypothetical protein
VNLDTSYTLLVNPRQSALEVEDPIDVGHPSDRFFSAFPFFSGGASTGRTGRHVPSSGMVALQAIVWLEKMKRVSGAAGGERGDVEEKWRKNKWLLEKILTMTWPAYFLSSIRRLPRLPLDCVGARLPLDWVCSRQMVASL